MITRPNFLRLADQKNLREMEDQQVAQYMNGPKVLIRDKIRLRVVYTLEQAQNLALQTKA